MNENTTRNAAVREIADCFDPQELLGFLGHKNKHTRKAALHKIIKLHRGIQTGVISEESKTLLTFCLCSWSGFKSTAGTGKAGECYSFLKANGKADVADLLFPPEASAPVEATVES